MNIQQIDYILAVEKYKNFGMAADKCYITQSTLSTMIGKFEQEFDIKIFDRKTKPVSITEEGKAIIQQLKIIKKEIDILKENVQALKGELSGKLKIGIIPTVAPFILPKFLNSFAQKFPNLSISVSEMTTNNIIASIEKRETDIGILATPIDNNNISEISLYNEAFVLYDYTNCLSKNKIDINTIDYNKLWLLEEGHCLRTQVETLCSIKNIKRKKGINFEYKAGSIDSLIRFVKQNKGLTILPHLAAQELNDQDSKHISHFRAPLPSRNIGLAVHKHFVKHKILELLKEEIIEKITPLLPTTTEEYKPLKAV